MKPGHAFLLALICSVVTAAMTAMIVEGNPGPDLDRTSELPRADLLPAVLRLEAAIAGLRPPLADPATEDPVPASTSSYRETLDLSSLNAAIDRLAGRLDAYIRALRPESAFDSTAAQHDSRTIRGILESTEKATAKYMVASAATVVSDFGRPTRINVGQAGDPRWTYPWGQVYFVDGYVRRVTLSK